MRRIAIFIPSLCAGGAERVLLNLAGGFARCGFGVDLLLGQAEGPFLSDVPPGIRVVDLKAKRVISSIPALVIYLRRDKPMGLVSALSHANVIASISRVLARTPTRLIVTEHTHISQSQLHAGVRRERLLPTLMRYLYRKADGIVAVSNGVADELVKIVGLERSQITVIGNPVVDGRLLGRAEALLNHAWFDDSAQPVVLGVGRLSEAKDFATLIRAFALLRRSRPARLMILGEGEKRAELESLIQELSIEGDVALPGFVSNPYQYMRRASIFVLSSRFEGLPTVLIEAMACGTQVVSTDCLSGPAEILEDGRWGSLVPVGNANALAEALAASLDQTKRPEVIKRAAAYSVERATQAYLQILAAIPVQIGNNADD